jgi:hypothetical protein
MPLQKVPLGGEIACSPTFLAEYCFSSGRDSLWTIFNSLKGLANRLFLPDFLCDVILDYAADFGFEIKFYSVNDNLVPLLPACQKNDVVYLINYFGDDKSGYLDAANTDTIAIVDDVFHPLLRKPQSKGIYFTFNSLRKISQLPEISFLGSNFPITSPPATLSARFHHLNRLGKRLKHGVLATPEQSPTSDEQYYLDVLHQSELLRNKEKGPFRPSQESIFMLPDYYSRIRDEGRHRKARYQRCAQHIPDYTIPLNATAPSHAPLWVSRRDEALTELKHNAIFLPGIWPHNFSAPRSGLYDHLLCIPLDARFTKARLDLILNIVKDHL